MTALTITNHKILKYFNDHKEIDPEVSFLLLIDILEKFGDNIIEKMGVSINKQILDCLNENSRTLTVINDNIGKINSEITNTLFIKMSEIKREYIEDTKTILSSNTYNINEKIETVLDKNNERLLDKTKLLLNDIIPKSNENLYTTLNEKINLFNQSLKDETQKIFKHISTDETNINQYFTKFEKDISTLFSSLQNGIQQPLHMYITTSEERINKNISNITEMTKENIGVQSKLYVEMNDFLNKYRSPNYKGGFHENQLKTLLNKMFSNGEIIDSTGQTSCGDFILKRPNKPNIMFENKHYAENVYNSEIVKFINDSENLKMHSIFLSQQSGIAGKSNYQIDYNHGCILVYVHNTDYCREKVQIAVDIIDNLSLKINELTEDDESNFISKELLEEINRDYQQFALKKDTLIGLTKEFSKKSLQNLEEMKLPSLDKYFLSRFASTEKPNRLKNQYVCEICNVYICSTLKAMSAHKRGCKNSFKNTLTVTEEK